VSLSNVATSKTSVATRWRKTYRRLHNLFIADELVHIKDFQREIDAIHKRIDDLNLKLDNNLTNLAAMVNTHFHVAPQAPAGSIPTLPTATPFTPDPSPIIRIPFKDVEMQAADLQWRLEGPSAAPISTGASVEEQTANATAGAAIIGEG